MPRHRTLNPSWPMLYLCSMVAIHITLDVARRAARRIYHGR